MTTTNKGNMALVILLIILLLLGWSDAYPSEHDDDTITTIISEREKIKKVWF